MHYTVPEGGLLVAQIAQVLASRVGRLLGIVRIGVLLGGPAELVLDIQLPHVERPLVHLARNAMRSIDIAHYTAEHTPGPAG